VFVGFSAVFGVGSVGVVVVFSGLKWSTASATTAMARITATTSTSVVVPWVDDS